MRGTGIWDRVSQVARSQSMTGLTSGHSRKACDRFSATPLARQVGAWHRGSLPPCRLWARNALQPKHPCNMRQQVMRWGRCRVESVSRNQTCGKPPRNPSTTPRAVLRSSGLGRGCGGLRLSHAGSRAISSSCSSPSRRAAARLHFRISPLVKTTACPVGGRWFDPHWLGFFVFVLVPVIVPVLVLVCLGSM